MDAIGGSAAGVYVNNRVKAGSLFRGVPQDLFDARVKDIFFEVRQGWHDVPFEVVNDGEVTALAGSMSLGKNAILGIALGTSTAAGYVTPDGNITSWLNELAFVPDRLTTRGSGRRVVGRLRRRFAVFLAAGRRAPGAACRHRDAGGHGPAREAEGRAEAAWRGRTRAPGRSTRRSARTSATASRTSPTSTTSQHVLVLGRVTSGPGGDDIVDGARACSTSEFPELARRITFHVPDEKDKRHGQAIAAASLPEVTR